MLITIAAQNVDETEIGFLELQRREKLAQAKREVSERMYWYVGLSLFGTYLLTHISTINYLDVFLVNQVVCYYNLIVTRAARACLTYLFMQLLIFLIAYVVKESAYLPCISLFGLLHKSFELHHTDKVPLPIGTFIMPMVFYASHHFGLPIRCATCLLFFTTFLNYCANPFSSRPIHVFGMLPLFLSSKILVYPHSYPDVYLNITYMLNVCYFYLCEDD